MVGYPPSTHILNPSSSFSHSSTVYHSIVNSIEMLYLVPRVLMGILAVVDTFLVYKIAERRYSRNVAVIASILFAVMPSLLYNRWILLDNILMPLFLSSILFALYHYRKDSPKPDKHGDGSDSKTLIPILMSGIFLGLAIFTKIPTFTMIPVVGFLIFTNSNRSLRVLGLWLIPVILIPSIWPAYNISSGRFNEWLNGIVHQETRGIYYKGDKILSNALNQFFAVVVISNAMILLFGPRN
jgi:4-amino-4-deoxy-L-arabinose transferase-like glycosyltransferase